MYTQKSNPNKALFIICFVILAIMALTLVSCGSDEEHGPDTRSLFVGTYEVEEVSAGSGNVYHYDVTIANGSGNQLEISNFGDIFNVPVKANVNGNNLTIPSQSFTNPSSMHTIEVSGSGTIEGNTLTFTYTTTGYLEYAGTCVAERQ